MNKNICKKYRGLLLLLLPAVGLVSAAADGIADAGYPVPAVVSVQDTAAILYELGVSRMNGEGAEQDIVQGRYWIHLAARHGYPLAQYNLGVMYFDGIGGTYSRQCAQWWLNRAAGQDDAEVRQMAGQALKSIEPEMALLPKVYRQVTDQECDLLPEWRRKERSVRDIPVSPEGDIDTEKMVIVTEASVPEQTAVTEVRGRESTESVVETEATDNVATETNTGADVSETVPETEGTTEQETSAKNTAVTVSRGDVRALADPVSVRENRAPDTGETDPELLPVPEGGDDAGKTETTETTESGRSGKAHHGEPKSGTKPVSGGAEKGTAVPADVVPMKPKTLKPREVRPAAVLNLGGSPATAPGKYYTLQLSGGTIPDELYRMARRHKLTNYVVYETERSGQRWYVLVAGEYATLTAANQALKVLPAELRRNGPWVRSLRQVQNELHK